MVPEAATPPSGSATGNAQTSVPKLLAKNVWKARPNSEPWPNAASASICRPIGTGTSGCASPVLIMVPISSALYAGIGAPAFDGSTSTQYSGCFITAGICENDTGMTVLLFVNAIASPVRGCAQTDGHSG